MCLAHVYKGKEKKEKLAKLPDVITVWKVVEKWDKGDYVTDCKYFPLHAGEVKFKQNVINGDDDYGPKYRGGGHFFLKRCAAYAWRLEDEGSKVVKCQIKKEWINNIGRQAYLNEYGSDVVVVKKAVFPVYFGEKK